MSTSTTKRRRADSIDGPTKKVKAGSKVEVKQEEPKIVLPPKGTTAEELGFDPFAPHPGMTKEQRKMARMIRNRTAAQVSRDRKKEHVTELEDRVRELESQLAAFQQQNSSSSSASPLPPPSTSLPPLTSLPTRTPSPSPSHFSISSGASTISPTQAASLSQARIHALEEENERLRTRLEEEARSSGELKGRLEGVEKRFEWMERIFNGVVGIAATSNANTVPSSSTPTPAPIDWASLFASLPSASPTSSSTPTSTSTLTSDRIDPLVDHLGPVSGPSGTGSGSGLGSEEQKEGRSIHDDRLVAREEVFTLQRTWMLPSPLSSLPSRSLLPQRRLDQKTKDRLPSQVRSSSTTGRPLTFPRSISLRSGRRSAVSMGSVGSRASRGQRCGTVGRKGRTIRLVVRQQRRS